MADRGHLKILMQGAHVWNSWRRNRASIIPDLSGADLTNANVAGAHFHGASLEGTRGMV